MNDDGTYAVAYDDGDNEPSVRRLRIRRPGETTPALVEGMQIEARHQGGIAAYEGVISKGAWAAVFVQVATTAMVRLRVIKDPPNDIIWWANLTILISSGGPARLGPGPGRLGSGPVWPQGPFGHHAPPPITPRPHHAPSGVAVRIRCASNSFCSLLCMSRLRGGSPP